MADRETITVGDALRFANKLAQLKSDGAKVIYVKGFVRKVADRRVDAAIELAVRYGGIDGDHHKAWVIDQMVRVLAGDRYDSIVTEAKAGDEGPDSYDWKVGIAP